jgi:hypothetical protein
VSTYATIEGSIHYLGKKEYEAAVNVLIKGGWVNQSGEWIQETGRGTGLYALDAKNITISIPRMTYRNLLNVKNQLIKGANVSVKWASTDGVFEGGYWGEKSIDLALWAESRGSESEPLRSEYDNDDDHSQAEYDWKDSIVDEFFRKG